MVCVAFGALVYVTNKPANLLYKCTAPTCVLCACKHLQSRQWRVLPLSTVEESTETIENALHEAAKRGVWSVRMYVCGPRVYLCNF